MDDTERVGPNRRTGAIAASNARSEKIRDRADVYAFSQPNLVLIPLFTSSMSAPNTHSSVSFSQFNDLIDAALKEYSQKTGKDIPTHPLTARILRCDSSEAVLAVLQEHAHAFSQYRNGDWKTQLMRRLKPTVEILLGLSNSGVFGQVVGLVRLTNSTLSLRALFNCRLPAEFSAGAGDICRRWSPTRGVYLHPPLCPQL